MNKGTGVCSPLQILWPFKKAHCYDDWGCSWSGKHSQFRQLLGVFHYHSCSENKNCLQEIWYHFPLTVYWKRRSLEAFHFSVSCVFFFRLGQPEFKGPHPPQHLAPLSWSQPALAAHLRPALHPRLWDRRGHRLRWVRSTHPAKPLSYLDCASWISVRCMLWKLLETLYWPLKVCIGVLWHSIIYDSEILSRSAEFWS